MRIENACLSFFLNSRMAFWISSRCVGDMLSSWVGETSEKRVRPNWISGIGVDENDANGRTGITSVPSTIPRKFRPSRYAWAWNFHRLYSLPLYFCRLLNSLRSLIVFERGEKAADEWKGISIWLLRSTTGTTFFKRGQSLETANVLFTERGVRDFQDSRILDNLYKEITRYLDEVEILTIRGIRQYGITSLKNRHWIQAIETRRKNTHQRKTRNSQQYSTYNRSGESQDMGP